MSGAVIDVEGLRVRVGGTGSGLVRLSSWCVERGRHAAIVGPSGCGKTTLVRALAGIVAAEGGLVRVLGTELAGPGGAMGEPGRRRFRAERLGLVFQHLALIEYLTVRDNVTLPCRVAGGVGRGDRARAEELLGRVGLGACAGRRPGKLSHGERQRVALCRALVRGPALVLADEPTASLDPELARSALDLMLEVVNGVGATLVMVTHDRGLLDRFDSVLDASGLLRGAGASGAAA